MELYQFNKNRHMFINNILIQICIVCFLFFFSSRRRHTSVSGVTGVQTCALPISVVGGTDPDAHYEAAQRVQAPLNEFKIGRASCRERECQYVENSVVAVCLKKKKDQSNEHEQKNTQKSNVHEDPTLI